MKNEHFNEHFTIEPMENYTSPSYPNRNNVDGAKLRKMPKRWAGNVAMVACIGALTLGTLTGIGTVSATPHYNNTPETSVVYSAESRGILDVVVHTHYGGSGSGPYYVAYLTEQEALGIIRNRLISVGVGFDSPVPDYTATLEVPYTSTPITARLSFFDEDTRLGIVFPRPWDWWHEFQFWYMPQNHIENTLRWQFSEQFNVNVTFMNNPGESMCDGDWMERDWETKLTFSEEEKQAAGLILRERLEYQVDDFIEKLRADGIVPPAPPLGNLVGRRLDRDSALRLAHPFEDVLPTAWYADAVRFMYDSALMVGTSPTTFAPARALTRAQVVTILYRMEGEPAVDFQPTFNDVPITAPAWYRNAVIWASESGIVQGVNGRFDPYGEITREQFATMLYRLAPPLDEQQEAQMNFPDADQISDWAEYAINWAVASGIMQGSGGGYLNPQGTATRAQGATMLLRFEELLP